MEEWKGGRFPTAPPLIVIRSEQKNKAIGFYGHETLYKLESAGFVNPAGAVRGLILYSSSKCKGYF